MSEVGLPQEKSPSKRLKVSDKEFSPPVDMMVNDFDDERTLEEEEAMETNEDHQEELNSLQKEGDMPLDELLAMYGYNGHNNERSPSHAGSEQETASVKEHGADVHITDPLAPSVSDPLMLDEEVEDDEEEEEEEEEEQPVSQLAKLYEQGCSSTSKDGTLCKSLDDDDDDFSFFDDQQDEDDDPKKTIMVGTDYQAWIPEGLCTYGDILPYENEDKLLWDPYSELITAEVLESYLQRSHDLRIVGEAEAGMLPMGSHLKDDEQALYDLLECKYNIEEALKKNGSQLVKLDVSPSWSEDECKNFESGLRMYGKNFFQIQQNKVQSHSVGEIVQFYYLWKKTERHDVFANKARLEKKKYSLHPGITDYMDRFLEDQDSIINPPASPSVYLISDGNKRQRNQSTNKPVSEESSSKSDRDKDISQLPTSSDSTPASPAGEKT